MTLTATTTITVNPPPDPTGQLIRFAVIGDYGDGSAREGEEAAMIGAWGAESVATVGYNRYGNRSIDRLVGRYCSRYIGDY